MPSRLQLVSEPRRLEILRLIWDRERSVGDIADRLPVSIAAVSQHLAKLRRAGLVTVRQEGRRRLYRAHRGDMGTLAIYLESMWAERLDRLGRMAEADDAPADSHDPNDSHDSHEDDAP